MLWCSKARWDFTKWFLGCGVSITQDKKIVSDDATETKRTISELAESDFSNSKWNPEHCLKPVKPMWSFKRVEALREDGRESQSSGP